MLLLARISLHEKCVPRKLLLKTAEEKYEDNLQRDEEQVQTLCKQAAA